ncbi:MAG: hypothetical protein M3N00_02765 [Actinomycetota bacterium]|nr:hypothetical protein [Actinomycetota bacterium]
MKTERRFPLWIWVLGPIVVVVTAMALLALLRVGDPAGPEAGVTLDEITEDPSRFFGETVTVEGGVAEVLGPRSFLISERLSAGDLLVVSPVPLSEVGGQRGGDPLSDDEMSEDELVQVTGEVVRFDIAGAEQRIGEDLDGEALDAYVGTPAIIADSISLRPPDVFEEGARGASGEA